MGNNNIDHDQKFDRILQSITVRIIWHKYAWDAVVQVNLLDERVNLHGVVLLPSFTSVLSLMLQNLVSLIVQNTYLVLILKNPKENLPSKSFYSHSISFDF
jgi:hypothetical protein